MEISIEWWLGCASKDNGYEALRPSNKYPIACCNDDFRHLLMTRKASKSLRLDVAYTKNAPVIFVVQIIEMVWYKDTSHENIQYEDASHENGS